MDAADEVQILWAKLERNFNEIAGQPIDTCGLQGRASGKQFTPAEYVGGRAYLTIEGRDGSPRQRPFVRPSDLEAYLRFERGEITSAEARRSFRTSYAGPLIRKLRQLPS